MELIRKFETLNLYSEDFGHLVKNAPVAVARPVNIEEIQTIIRNAAASKIAVTTRGLGRSQSGQAIAAKNSLILDNYSVNGLENIEKENKTIWCEAGCTWKEIINKTLPSGLIPPSIPLNLNLTLGGTLSIGGVGTSSFKNGISAANVKKLKVVNCDGDLVTCSAEENKDYYHGTLSNLGRCGVIGAAELQLVDVKRNIRTFFLLYDDIKLWIQDQRELITRREISHLQGVCSANVQGLRKGESMYIPFVHWFYGLQISYEFGTREEIPSPQELLQGLNYYKLLQYEDDSILNFTHRFEARFEAMKKTGQEYQPHPWLEAILPAKVLADVLPNVLKRLPISLGDGHRLIWINKSNVPNFFITPEGDENAIFAILPTGVAPVYLQDTLKALRQVHDILIEAGGKRYLSGWLDMMDEPSWRLHFGSKYDEWRQTKSRLDPLSIFRNKLFQDKKV